MKTEKTFTWNQINTALTMKGYSPAQILRIFSALNTVKKENLEVVPYK